MQQGGHFDAAARAKRARSAMERAFEDAMVSDYDATTLWRRSYLIERRVTAALR